MKLKTISDFSFKGKKVLLRVDVNAALNNKRVMDSPRFTAAALTIKDILKKGAKVCIIAHQGRKGDSDFIDLSQHARLLGKKVKQNIKYVDSLFEDQALQSINSLKDGEAILLKNVRGYDDEKDIASAENKYFQFCKNFDIYINDAFSVSHREQGSIIIPPQCLPSCIGLSMEKEIAALSNFSFAQEKKNVYLIGGAKIDDYLPIFNVLKNKKSILLPSGVLANLFLVAKGVDLGYENSWLKDKGFLSLLPELKKTLSKYKSQIILPIDFAVGNISGEEKRKELSTSKLPTQEKIWDVGQQTLYLFTKHLQSADSAFMKGPLGFSEKKQYSHGTVSILKELSKLTKHKRLFSLLGGGHLTTSIQEYKIPDHFSYISISGGALIAYISGKKLPGLVALEQSKF